MFRKATKPTISYMQDISHYPVAGPMRRLAALVYDSFLVLAISMAYGAMALFARVLILGKEVAENTPAGIWFPGGWIAVVVLFFCFFWHRDGQTLGMRAWRLRLVNADTGRNPGWGQCLLRCLTAPLSLALLGIGYWWCILDKDGHSLHDRLTKTWVALLPKKGS